MWTILKTELAYHKNSILLFLTIIAFTYLYNAVISPGNAEFMIFIMSFLIINSIISTRLREKRNRQHFRLPVSAHHIALARVLDIYLPCCFAFVELLILHFIFQKNIPFQVGKISILIGIGIFLYSLFFIFYDLYSSFFKKYGKFLLVLLVLGLSAFMAAGILVMKQTNATGAPPGLLISIIDFVKNNNPFAGESGWIRFLIVNLILSSITIITFGRCKSYVE